MSGRRQSPRRRPENLTVIAKNVSGGPLTRGTVCILVGFGAADEGGKSPVAEVVRAGSGALVPLISSNPGRQLVGVSGPFGSRDPKSGKVVDLPTGSFLGPDVAVSPVDQLAWALMNPARALSMSMDALGDPKAGVIRQGADWILEQLFALITFAAAMLDRVAGGESVTRDRDRARDLLLQVQNWTTYARVNRSGRDADAPLIVPSVVSNQARSCARLGRRLAASVVPISDPRPEAHTSIGSQLPPLVRAHEAEVTRWGQLVRFLRNRGVQGLDHRVQHSKHILPEPAFKRGRAAPFFFLGQAWKAAKEVGAQWPANLDLTEAFIQAHVLPLDRVGEQTRKN